MFLKINSLKKEEKKQVDLEGLRFKFMDNKIGEVRFKGATFASYSLATLMYDRPEKLLAQIRGGMKIVDGNDLKDMDKVTFDALIEYGNTLCSSARPGL
jgi:hypothetical protein